MLENIAAIDLAVGRSSVRQRILALLMAEPGVRLHLREIQRRAATSPGTASRELGRLVAAGLIEREAEGNQVYFRASSSPFATMLRSVLLAMPAQTFAPRPRRVPRASTPRPGAELHPEVAVDRAVPAAVDEPVAAESPHNAAAAVASETESMAASAPAREPQPAVPPRLVRPVAPHPAAPKPAAIPDPVAMRIATRLADSIREIYGESVRGVYLYGARAAGNGQADSDVETIVVLDRVEHYGAELERTSHVCSELSHEMNLVVSRIFVADEDWNGEGGPAEAIRAESVAV